MDNLPAIVPRITIKYKMTFGHKFIGVGDLPARTITTKIVEGTSTYYRFADGTLVYKNDPTTTD